MKTIIGYMVCGRYAGLKEEELIDLLFFDEEYYESFLKGSQHIDELMERRKIPRSNMVQVLSGPGRPPEGEEVEGVRILTFFHRQIDEYMKERYGTNRNRNHGILADYGLKRFEDEGKLERGIPFQFDIAVRWSSPVRSGEEKELLHLLPEEEKHKNKENKKDIPSQLHWLGDGELRVRRREETESAS